MKFLIAFAVIAVAFATEEIRVVHLPPAPAPEVASPDYLPLVAPASLFDAMKMPTPNEDTVIEQAEALIVGEIPSNVQNEYFKVNVADGPLDAPDAVDAHIEQLEPIRIGEIPTAEVAPIEPVKVAVPVIENAAPIEDTVIEKAETLMVGEIPSNAPVEDVQNEFKVKIVDGPLLASNAIEQLEPIMVGEIQTAGAPIEHVKVAVPVMENEAPISKVNVVNLSMPPRYADPTLR